MPTADRIPLSELQPWKRNYNQGDVDAIYTSIARFGFNGTLRVWRNSIVIAGNHALLALRRMHAAGELPPEHVTADDDGDWLIPVTSVEHLSKLEAEAFAVADNRTRDLAQSDDELLAELLQEIANEDRSLLAATGFDDADLEGLLRELGQMGDPPPDPGAQIERAAELQEEWQTAEGQIWQLGEHRLAVGDSTGSELVATLMDGEQAVLMWTDPPYGVGYVGGTKDALTIENDNADGLESLLTSAFAVCDAILADGAAIYVAHPAGQLSVTFGLCFLRQGWRLHQTLIWVKDRLVLGRSDYHYRHEPILFGYKPGSGRRGRGGDGWYGDNAQDTVFEVERPQRNEEHPTMKPVELLQPMIANSSPPGALVYEPFCGSGSTLIAAEQLGRRCFAVEIDPRYAAVTIQRWVDMTAGEPEVCEA